MPAAPADGSQATEPDTSADGTQGSDLRSLILKVIAAIASGVGVVGFVTAVGGAVLWIRFDSVGIPAHTAVSVIPSAELLSVGLSTLLPYIALGIAAVGWAYLFASSRIVPTEPPYDVEALWGSPGAAPQKPGEPEGSIQPPEPRDATANQLDAYWQAREAFDLAASAWPSAEVGNIWTVKRLRRRVDRAAARALNVMREDRPPSEAEEESAVHSAVRRLAHMAQVRAEAAEQHAKIHRLRYKLSLFSAVGLVVVAEGLIVFASQRGKSDPPAIIVLAAFAVALVVLAIYVGWRTRGFAPFGIAIFLAVLIFGAGQTLYRTQHSPRLQAAAVLRIGPDFGFTGFYIAETNDRVYMARISAEKYDTKAKKVVRHAFDVPRIVILPRSSIAEMLIGPPQSSVRASEESGELLKELCKNKVRLDNPTAAEELRNPCPPPVSKPKLEERNERRGEARNE